MNVSASARSPSGWLVVLAPACALVAAVLAFGVWSGDDPAIRSGGDPGGVAAHEAMFFDRAAFGSAVQRAATEPAAPVASARAAVFPHHWFAGHLITETLRDIAASGEFDRVILLGPNHVDAGTGSVATSDVAWQTPVGRLDADAEAVASLTLSGVARIEPEVLLYEHSISGIVPAIEYYFGDAELVPLSLRSGMTTAEVDKLAERVASLMDAGTVLLASVDFSHYLPAAVARARDEESIEAIVSLDADRLLDFGNEHMDSGAAIATMVETMSLIGATSFVLRENTNSEELGAPAGEPVTSYVTGMFTPGRE